MSLIADIHAREILDSRGKHIIENYRRFIPEFNTETYSAIFFIFIGIAIVLGLEWYGRKTRQTHA